MASNLDGKNLETKEVRRLADSNPLASADDVQKSHRFERREIMKDGDSNWDDEYVLDFVKNYPAPLRQHVEDFDRVFKMDKSTVEYIAEKAKLFKNIVGTMIWRVDAEYRLQQEINKNLPLVRDPVSRQALADQVKKSQDLAAAYELFKGNMVLYADAYDRFEHDRVDVERRLLLDIESGKIKVVRDFPYVMFVNKEVDKQYAVIYRYDVVHKKLIFKTCNVVSTGDEVRWNASEPYDHSTPEKVFYIGAVRAVRESGDEVYGGDFAGKDKKPYKIFRLYTGGGRTNYLVHPTNEEPLLGVTASHGCIRVPRRMNLQLVDIYDEWCRQEGEENFTEFPPSTSKERNDVPKMPVVVDGI